MNTAQESVNDGNIYGSKLRKYFKMFLNVNYKRGRIIYFYGERKEKQGDFKNLKYYTNPYKSIQIHTNPYE